ncbi:hypothetical protein LCGC14_0708760 [marine sediment metagenome]|uniref:Uncharacterized protein n=1 Tax=marine sediment metagenome TaxID=412755 RepID=A0A0F9QKA3_9ZZZZ
MNIIRSILLEYGPCSSTEILDYIRSELFYKKGYYSPQEWTERKIKYQLDKLSTSDNKVFRLQSSSGFKFRYGYSKFDYFLLREPRYLKVEGYLKRCMFCGMPIYIFGSKIFHFKYNCQQYTPQNHFKLLKVDIFWAVISRDFVYGVIDNLESCTIRLPGKNRNNSYENILSELWLINEKAREKEIIEFDRILPLKVEEYLV